MPECDARYYVSFNDIGEMRGFIKPEYTRAFLDFCEERIPDDIGDPGIIVDARLERYWPSKPAHIRYERRYKRLWLNGEPHQPTQKERIHLIWRDENMEPIPAPDLVAYDFMP